MKIFRSRKGPFAEQPYYELRQINQICEDELRSVGLYPAAPAPIRIDRFIEKRFKVSPTYAELPTGLLGFTKFGPNGVDEVVISKALDDERTKSAERRLRTTLAHEGGHGLLHAHLFALTKSPKSLFGDGLADDSPKILCRDDAVNVLASKGYDGRWWEYQANQAMGALLLPAILVDKAIESMMVTAGMLDNKVLPEEHRDAAAHVLTGVFNVNPIVAQIRLDALYPPASYQQLSL